MDFFWIFYLSAVLFLFLRSLLNQKLKSNEQQSSFTKTDNSWLITLVLRFVFAASAMCVCIHIHMYVCMHTYIHTYASFLPGLCVCIPCASAKCVYAYIYTCMYAYIHTHICLIPPWSLCLSFPQRAPH